jgi:tRNA threonylcarbamoyladenosine biosynthesis protein TsaB
LKLAIDSSQSSGSIALQDNGRLVYSAYFDLRVTHSETLMPAIDNALKLSGKSPEALSEIYVSMGPGSFTGLRIGLATAKGIAFARKIPVLAFNSLQMAAYPCTISGKRILSVIDAKMKEIYAALYEPDLTPIISPQVMAPNDLIAWDLEDCIITGSATEIVSEILRDSSVSAQIAPPLFHISKAEMLFALAEILPPMRYDADALAELEPYYLRESTAQIKRKKSLN